MKRQSRPRLASASALALLLSATTSLHAATSLTWATSATGTWDTTTATAWNPGPVAWNNANNDTAVFGGATYAVTVQGAGVTVGGLEFQSANNVTLQTGAITLSEASVGAGVLIRNTGGVSSNPQINSVLTGTTNVTFAAGSNMTLGAANTYVGDTTTTGSLRLNVTNALSTATTLTISSGSVRFLGSSGSVNQEIAGLSGSGFVNFSTSGSTLTINTKNGITTTHSGANSGTGGLTIKGAGTQVLSASNTYTGATTISGGTLKLGSASAINLVNTGSVTINGGTLTNAAGTTTLGSGAVSMSSGAITPGGAGVIGSFSLAANQNFTTTGGTLTLDLLNSSSFDQIIGSGSGSFGLANTTLALSGLTSVAGTYQLFSGFGGTNTVSGLTITGLDSGFTGSLGTDGILTVSAIPEPSTCAALAGLGALGLAALRRRA